MKIDSTKQNNKRIIIYIITVLILALAGTILYECFGDNIIEDAYQGKSLDVLNDLIKYQHKKPVEHYLQRANSAFYTVLALGIVVLIVPPCIKSFVGKCVKERRIDQDSVSKAKRIFLLALGLRIIILPFLLNLKTAGDESYYWGVPQSLMSLEITETVLRPPLWGYMLLIPALICKHPIAGRVVSVLIGSLTPVLVYVLARLMFNKRIGFLAALLFAFYPEHIAFSHYLWSEILLIPLCLLAGWFFFSFVKGQYKTHFLYLGFLIVGIALLAKEFALIMFLGMITALFFVKTKQKIKKVLIGCLLFILPAVTYSVAISCVTDNVIILSDAAISNFRLAADIDEHFNYSFQDRKDLARGLVEHIRSRSLSETLGKMKEQFFNLWTPNSFPIIRLLSLYRPEQWNYGFPRPWPLICLTVGFYVFIILTGLAGMCLTEWDLFKTFSVTCLVTLSLTGVLAFLSSRFRLPYMFIFIIYSACFLTNTKALLSELKDYKKAIPLLLLIALFLCVLYLKIPTFRQWG